MAFLQGLISSAQEIENQLIESGGELTEEMEKQIRAIQLQLPSAVESLVMSCERLDEASAYWSQKAAAFQKLAKALSRAADLRREHMKATMKVYGVKELKGVDHRVVLSNARPKMIVDFSKLMDEYKITMVEKVADKKKIEEDLKQGIPVPGAHYEDSVQMRVYLNKEAAKK